MRPAALIAGFAGVGGAAAATYVGLVTGRLTLNLDVGRRTRPLGPITVHIAAPCERVYAAAVAPYAERRPRALAEKVRILERSDHMVLAAHHTPMGKRLTAVTVETVAFDPPHKIGFRLVRGPVPLVSETFDFEPTETGTLLTYSGELGTDLGRLGELWGTLVASSWITAVEHSLELIRAASEGRVASGRERPTTGRTEQSGAV